VVTVATLIMLIQQAADLNTMAVVAESAYRALGDELGDEDTVFAFLTGQATKHGRPVAANLRTGEQQNCTIIFGPATWTDERTLGWLSGRHVELERVIGKVVRIRSLSDPSDGETCD
jgi:hypothetical protein